MNPWPRSILHVDMDAFYAAIEQRDNPELRNKPVLVGGRGKRGVVTTASYEARPFGCRSAQPMAQALRLCPHAVVVPVRMNVYAEESRRIRAILENYSPDIEPVSIDEAFIDLTHVAAWNSSPDRVLDAAREIKSRIRATTRLTASIGVAPNKFLAKVASDMHKPDGLSVIPPGQAERILSPMSVSVIWGVGKVAQAKLAEIGIRTVRDLLDYDHPELARRFGDAAGHWKRLARGDDHREVATSRVSKSIGKERTFGDDVSDPKILAGVLMDELEHAARSLREDHLLCRRVALKLRRPDFTTYSRSAVLPEPTDSTPELWAVAHQLLTTFLNGERVPLRLIGVRLEDLSASRQLGLFDHTPQKEKSSKVDAVADQIAQKFGHRSIGRAAGLHQPKRSDKKLGGPET